MANVIDCANFFIDDALKRHEHMTNMRINKLLYFAQGYHLARTNRCLFDDPIEAWTYGPVVAQVYQTYKKYRRNPITSLCGDYDESLFDFEEKETLTDVCRRYRNVSTHDLVEMSHAEDGPWNESINHNTRYIGVKEMYDFFSKLLQVDLFESALEVNAYELTGYRNANGILVLECEDDDDDDWSEYDEM